MKKVLHDDTGLKITVTLGSVRATFLPELRREIKTNKRNPAFLVQRDWNPDVILFIEPEKRPSIRFPKNFHEAENLLFQLPYSYREKCLKTFLETH